MSRPWIEFIVRAGERKVQCPRCGKLIGPQRMARGAHAAWCLRPRPSVESKERSAGCDSSSPKTESLSFAAPNRAALHGRTEEQNLGIPRAAIGLRTVLGQMAQGGQS